MELTPLPPNFWAIPSITEMLIGIVVSFRQRSLDAFVQLFVQYNGNLAASGARVPWSFDPSHHQLILNTKYMK